MNTNAELICGRCDIPAKMILNEGQIEAIFCHSCGAEVKGSNAAMLYNDFVAKTREHMTNQAIARGSATLTGGRSFPQPFGNLHKLCIDPFCVRHGN